MAGKNLLKLVTSLQQKKYRDEHRLFIAEGRKVVEELAGSKYNIRYVFFTPDAEGDVPLGLNVPVYPLSEIEMKKISALSTPPGLLAVADIPDHDNKITITDLTLALDDIRDPGNLGTLIRVADWFGIRNIIASRGTADVYNPKVIQSTMGSFTRVKLTYTDLNDFLKNVNVPVYGTFLDGKNIYGEELSTKSVVVIGNESAGISDAVSKTVHHRITIPSYSSGSGAESLNAAIAGAIVIAEFKRRT